VKANPADVDSIADIIRVDYECVSGPAGAKEKVRQEQRDHTLYMPGARFVGISEENGKLKIATITEKEYWKNFNSSRGAYETQVGQLIEHYGNLAQVRSVSVLRETSGGPVTERYINYYHLYFDGVRWWIAGIIWQKESPSTPIPESWIGKWQEVTH
jgi:hypothetical protein